MKRDARPQGIVRDTGKAITVYATECTCGYQFRPMAVKLNDNGIEVVRYVCRDCNSLWMNDVYLFRMPKELS